MDFRVSQRKKIHEEKLILPANISYSDFILVLNSLKANIKNVEFQSNNQGILMFVQRGKYEQISKETFKAAIKKRVQALQRNHLLERIPLYFQVYCHPVGPVNVYKKPQGEQMIQEAADELQ